jgi:putative RecB family exonuclease
MKKCGMRSAECGVEENSGGPVQGAGLLKSGPAFDDAKPGDPLEYLSASRLKSFLTCRLKFYYEKVLGLRAPSSPNLQIGKAVHAGLEAFHRARWQGGDTDTPAILDAYRKAYAEQESEDPVEYEEKDREDCVATGERVLRAYLESELANDPRRILGVETYLRREDDALPIPLVGVLDLVREGGVPVDFKTVGATPDLEDEAWSHELQLVAYWLLLADATNEMPAPAELVYLVKTKTPKIIQHRLPPVDAIKIERFKRLTEVYVDGVKRGEFYPSPGMHCRWCEFRGRCRAWGRKAA